MDDKGNLYIPLQALIGFWMMDKLYNISLFGVCVHIVIVACFRHLKRSEINILNVFIQCKTPSIL